MFKKHIYLCEGFLFVVFFIFSFTLYSQNQSDKINISGTLKKADKNARLFLYEIGINEISLIDSVSLSKKGTFKYTIVNKNTIFLLLKTDKGELIKLIGSPDDNIIISGNYTRLFNTYKIEGSKDSEILRKIDSTATQNNTKLVQMNEFLKSSNNSNIQKIKDSLDGVYQKIFNEGRNYLLTIIHENPGSLACLTAVNQNLGKKQVFTPENDRVLFLIVSELLMEAYPDNIHAKTFDQNIKTYFDMLGQKEDIEKRAGIGVSAPDISLFTKDSIKISLSELKGKTTLLKFWNPNCDVCRAEIKALLPIYAKYKELGFEVFTVSIGTKRDEWLTVMEEENMQQWINVKIPEEGDNIPNMGSYYVWLYGIQSVPYSFFINKKGVIVRKGFKPEDVEEILEAILNK